MASPKTAYVSSVTIHSRPGAFAGGISKNNVCTVPRARDAVQTRWRARTSVVRVIRAGLYPEPDSADSVPNPAQKNSRPESTSAQPNETYTPKPSNHNEADTEQHKQKPEDVLEPTILERARNLFNFSSSFSQSQSKSPQGQVGQASSDYSGGASTYAPNSDDSQPYQQASGAPLKGNVEFWAADEIDVAAAEFIKKDHESTPSDSANVPEQNRLTKSNQTADVATSTIDIQRASRALWRAGWWAWWTQLVLTTIAGVIVLFVFAFPGVNIRTTASSLGVLLCGSSVVIALTSLLWTYGYTRLAIRVRRSQPKFLANAPARVRGYIRVGVVLSIFGLFVGLVGLQAIVGTLLARLLGSGVATTPYSTLQSSSYNKASAALANGASVVQPVDVLVIQASANAMSALLAGLITAIWLRGRLRFWVQKDA